MLDNWHATEAELPQVGEDLVTTYPCCNLPYQGVGSGALSGSQTCSEIKPHFPTVVVGLMTHCHCFHSFPVSLPVLPLVLPRNISQATYLQFNSCLGAVCGETQMEIPGTSKTKRDSTVHGAWRTQVHPNSRIWSTVFRTMART